MSVQMIPILELRLKKTDFYTSFVKLLTGQSFRGYANEPISIPHKGGRKELPTFLLIFRFTQKKNLSGHLQQEVSSGVSHFFSG